MDSISTEHPNFSSFFWIDNKSNIIKKKKKEEYRCSQWWTMKRQQKAKKQKNQETILREEMNSIIEEQSKMPQHRDQSKRIRWHKSCNWPNNFSISSKERWFRSVQIIRLKQPGNKCQIFELCFPTHWHQQKNKLTTEPSMTHWIPKIWSNKEWVAGQRRKRWSTLHSFLIATTHTTQIR